MKTVPISRRVFLQSSKAVAAGLVLSPAIIGRAEAATMKMKCSSSLPNDPKYANGRVYYDNLVKHLKANGLGEQVEVTFFPDNQLGQEIDVINSVKLGVIDLMISGSSISANLVPLVGTFDLGYLFSSFPQQTKAFDAGAAKPIEDALLKGAGIRIISWAYNFGSRSVLAKKPVKRPEDLAGLKIRTLPNPVITECLRLMGAAATPLAFGEIYTALQAGVLDGLEHDPPTILASKFWETSKHYALTQHNFSPLATYFSEVTFNRMDPKLREGFLNSAKKAAADTRAHGLAMEKEALKNLADKGVTIVECDKEAFRKRVLPQTDNFIKARPRRSPWWMRSARRRPEVAAMSVAVPASGRRPPDISCAAHVSDVTAAILLVADLLVVCGSVLLRFLFNAPVEWADDVARGLMVGSSFFGAASALARSENLGVAFFIDMLPGGVRRVVDAIGALLVTIIAGYVAFNAIKMGWLTTGQTSGSGLPLEWTFYPMGVGALFMTVFAFELFCTRPLRDMRRRHRRDGNHRRLYLAWDFLSPNTVPSSNTLMLVGFFLTLFGGLPIGFALALAALIFIWVEGTLPGVIFAQQMARGIDNFVLLAIPFFILVGYLMEANGMSVRLIELLQRAVGRMRGGLNVVMVMSMVLFSGISGSKMADVAAVGSVLIPAARRSRQNPGSAVALLAASAVMAETIPPCINLIILGFVANLSIGGLFVAGILPAGLMALALIVLCIILGKRPAAVEEIEPQIPVSGLWSGAIEPLIPDPNVERRSNDYSLKGQLG